MQPDTHDTDRQDAAGDRPEGADRPAPEQSDRIQFGGQSMHLAFVQQISALLEQADLTEEQRQEFLVAMRCPCCGSGGLSLSLDLKPRTR